MNGIVIADSHEVADLLDNRRKNVPFVAELFANNGFKLVLGMGSGTGFVQHRRIDGDLPFIWPAGNNGGPKAGVPSF